MRELSVRFACGNGVDQALEFDLYDPRKAEITVNVSTVTPELVDAAVRAAEMGRLIERERQLARKRKVRHARTMNRLCRDVETILAERKMKLGQVDTEQLTPAPGAARQFRVYSRKAIPVD